MADDDEEAVGPGMACPSTIDFDFLRSTKNSRRKRIGGSEYDCFNDLIMGQIAFAPCVHDLEPELRARLSNGALGGLVGLEPQDEIEGMLIAQIIGIHCMAMECNRRAVISDQLFDARIAYMQQGAKLVQASSNLVNALNKHRGKGQQKVTVEHVHVHEGGQAIVGTVEQGGGGRGKRKGQAHAKSISHAPEPEVRSPLKTNGKAVPVAGDEERSMQDARG